MEIKELRDLGIDEKPEVRIQKQLILTCWLLVIRLIAAGKPLPQKVILADTEVRPAKAAGPGANLKLFTLCPMPYASSLTKCIVAIRLTTN